MGFYTKNDELSEKIIKIIILILTVLFIITLFVNSSKAQTIHYQIYKDSVYFHSKDRMIYDNLRKDIEINEFKPYPIISIKILNRKIEFFDGYFKEYHIEEITDVEIGHKLYKCYEIISSNKSNSVKYLKKDKVETYIEINENNKELTFHIQVPNDIILTNGIDTDELLHIYYYNKRYEDFTEYND